MTATDFDLTRQGTVLHGSAEGAGPPVVLLHGLTATRRYVTQGSGLLAREGFTTCAYDARGHGESSPAPTSDGYGYRELVDDLEAVLDDRDVERAVLAGSSMGAATAMAFTLAHPGRVSAMVQITPAYAGAPGADVAGWDALAQALEAGDVERFVGLAAPASLPDGMRDLVQSAIRQRIERHHDLGTLADAVRCVPRSAAFDGLGRLGDIGIPVLVVGSRDQFDPGHPLAVAQEYSERLPRGELIVEDAGASPLAWQGAQLSRAILEWLRRVEPRA